MVALCGMFQWGLQKQKVGQKNGSGSTSMWINLGDPSLISWTNILEGDNQLLQVPLTSTYVSWSTYRHVYTLNKKAKTFPKLGV